jgi:hypothetical protein
MFGCLRCVMSGDGCPFGTPDGCCLAIVGAVGGRPVPCTLCPFDAPTVCVEWREVALPDAEYAILAVCQRKKKKHTTSGMSAGGPIAYRMSPVSRYTCGGMRISYMNTGGSPNRLNACETRAPVLLVGADVGATGGGSTGTTRPEAVTE